MRLLHHVMATYKRYILMQTPLELDIWLQMLIISQKQYMRHPTHSLDHVTFVYKCTLSDNIMTKQNINFMCYLFQVFTH